MGSRDNFFPHIFVELKSAKGDYLAKAVDQATSSMLETVDNLGSGFSMYLVIVKGNNIAFFEYHNDRSNLFEDGVQNTKGAISFNHVKPLTPDGRPFYKGNGSLNEDFENGDANPKVIQGITLRLFTEDVTVEKAFKMDETPYLLPRR